MCTYAIMNIWWTQQSLTPKWLQLKLNDKKKYKAKKKCRTLFDMDCSTSFPFLEDRPLSSSSSRCLSILAKSIEQIHHKIMHYSLKMTGGDLYGNFHVIKIWSTKIKKYNSSKINQLSNSNKLHLHRIFQENKKTGKIVVNYYLTSCWTYRLCTQRMKCWGGTNARSMSTSATTMFLASFLNPSKAAVPMATTYTNFSSKECFHEYPIE